MANSPVTTFNCSPVIIFTINPVVTNIHINIIIIIVVFVIGKGKMQDFRHEGENKS
ncbi:MAG: hypothetical protein KGL39_19285 [Patescibacteria group bacterium]|nr:hypothetical protein [Patescibacteria group bacterium]